MSAAPTMPDELSSAEELIAAAYAHARKALVIIERNLLDWLHGDAKKQAAVVAACLRRKDILRLSLLDDLGDIECVLDNEISSRIVEWTAYSDHDCDVSDRGWTEVYYPPEAQALWVIRNELSLLSHAIGAAIDRIDAEEIVRTGRRTRNGLVPKAI